jgi:hypothetical protein
VPALARPQPISQFPPNIIMIHNHRAPLQSLFCAVADGRETENLEKDESL